MEYSRALLRTKLGGVRLRILRKFGKCCTSIFFKIDCWKLSCIFYGVYGPTNPTNWSFCGICLSRRFLVPTISQRLSLSIEHFDTLTPCWHFLSTLSLWYRALWHFDTSLTLLVDDFPLGIEHFDTLTLQVSKCQSARYLRGNRWLKVSIKRQSVKVLGT